MKPLITINTKSYFEGTMYMLGWIFCFMGLISIAINWYVTPVFTLLAVTILTAKYRLTINPTTKKIEDFLYILGLKTQVERFNYSSLHYIYITRSKYTQQMHMKSLSSTVSGEMFTAYLKSDVENHFLGESKNLSALQKKVKHVATPLNLEIKNP